jgi:hypothetical protein
MRDTLIFKASSSSSTPLKLTTLGKRSLSEDKQQPPPPPRRLKTESKIVAKHTFPNGDKVFKNKQPLVGKTLETKFRDDEGVEHRLKFEVWFIPGKTSKKRINIEETFKQDRRDMMKVQAAYQHEARDIYIGLRTTNTAQMHLEALNDSDNEEFANQLVEIYNVKDSDELKRELYRLSSTISDKMTSSNMFENRNDAKYMYLLCPCEGGHYLSLVNYDKDFQTGSKHLVIQFLTELSTADAQMKELVCTGIMSFHENRIIYIDGESGTYRPTDEHVKEAQHILSTAIHKSFVIPITQIEISAAFMFLRPLPNVLELHPDKEVIAGSAERFLSIFREKFPSLVQYLNDALVRWSCFQGETMRPMTQVLYSEELTSMITKLEIIIHPIDDCCLMWFPDDREKLSALLLRNGYTIASDLET